MMNPQFLQKFYEQFETSHLLSAVDHIDILRQELSDRADWRPPGKSGKILLKLHQLAMDVSHQGDLTQAPEMFELAFEIIGIGCSRFGRASRPLKRPCRQLLTWPMNLTTDSMKRNSIPQTNKNLAITKVNLHEHAD